MYVRTGGRVDGVWRTADRLVSGVCVCVSRCLRTGSDVAARETHKSPGQKLCVQDANADASYLYIISVEVCTHTHKYTMAMATRRVSSEVDACR